MRVRLRTSVAGQGFAYGADEVADVDDATGQAWCASGQAEPADAAEVRRRRPGGEQAIAPPAGEQATALPPSRKSR